jgi:hypothetical protein
VRGEGRQLAGWLVTRRQEIERAMERAHAGRLPSPASAEAEALRRLRSFATAALLHGDEAAPALDGLRVDLAKTGPLLLAWLEASPCSPASPWRCAPATGRGARRALP